MKKVFEHKGITLIALVITIIVLLILAGVTIASVTGENGILNKAVEAKNKTVLSDLKDQVSILKNGNEIEKNNMVSGSLKSVLKNEEFLAYENKLYILDGVLVYKNSNCTDEEINQFKQLNIKSIDEYTTISTKEELENFRDEVNKGNNYQGKTVYMINDINLENNANEQWKPIGNSENQFQGIFDGCGNEVNGIYIENTDIEQGLFGRIASSTIKNVGIGENCIIKAKDNSGLLVGRLFGDSNIINCYNKGSIDGKSSVGGIIGIMDKNCKILNCYNLGKIKGTLNVGGIIGNSMESSVENCYNSGEVEAIRPGGISGQSVFKSSVKNCYNVGKITKIEGNTWISFEHYGIVASIDPEDVVENCYYLSGSVNNGNDIDEREGIEVKNLEEMKNLTKELGEFFKNDDNNINQGFPILRYQ